MPPPPPARLGAAVDQAGGYAAGVTGSTIHNFRSYLAGRQYVPDRQGASTTALLVEIASENNSTTIFPLPIDLLKPFLSAKGDGPA